jgi:DNA polymerase-3 subunit gamma/tau
MEMFLIRLIYLKKISNHTDRLVENKNLSEVDINHIDENNTKNKQKIDDYQFDVNGKTIGQIKNVVQEKKQTKKSISENAEQKNLQIKTFDDLIDVCNFKKEIKLKYELETNVNLLSFDNQRIEISFNEKLEKNFIKNLSSKLYEWTNNRWIISLSKKNGEPSKKEKDVILKKKLLQNAKKSEVYKKVLETFVDAELIDIDTKKEKNND